MLPFVCLPFRDKWLSVYQQTIWFSIRKCSFLSAAIILSALSRQFVDRLFMKFLWRSSISVFVLYCNRSLFNNYFNWTYPININTCWFQLHVTNGWVQRNKVKDASEENRSVLWKSVRLFVSNCVHRININISFLWKYHNPPSLISEIYTNKTKRKTYIQYMWGDTGKVSACTQEESCWNSIRGVLRATGYRLELITNYQQSTQFHWTETRDITYSTHECLVFHRENKFGWHGVYGWSQWSETLQTGWGLQGKYLLLHKIYFASKLIFLLLLTVLI